MLPEGSQYADVCPSPDVTLTGHIGSRGRHCAVAAQTHGEIIARRYRHDVRPATYLALTMVISSFGNHRTVAAQAHCVVGAWGTRVNGG